MHLSMCGGISETVRSKVVCTFHWLFILCQCLLVLRRLVRKLEQRDIGGYVHRAQQLVQEKFVNQPDFPTGYSVTWSGQYEYMVRAQERLAVVGPITLAVILLLLFINFGRFAEVAIIMGTVPFALIGGVIGLWVTGEYLSVPASVATVTKQVSGPCSVGVTQTWKLVLSCGRTSNSRSVKSSENGG